LIFSVFYDLSDFMNIKKSAINFFKDLNMGSADIPYLLVLLVFSICLIAYIIDFNINLGIYCSDVFVYLLNSLNYYGINLGYNSTMFLSPVICFLTSILFRLGMFDQRAIFFVTGIFAIFGFIGMYVILKIRFVPILALTGSILFSSFSLNLLWLANGTLDIPAVSISIWVVIFTIIAVNKNSKFYILAIPLFVVGFFTRYTVGFILPLIIVYYLFNKNLFHSADLLFFNKMEFKSNVKSYFRSEEFKHMISGILLAIVLLAFIVFSINNSGSDLTFLSQSSDAISGSKGDVSDNAYTTDTFFYINNFLSFLFAQQVIFNSNIPVLEGIGFLSYVILFILIFGILLLFRNLHNLCVDNHKFNMSNDGKFNLYENSKKIFNNKLLFILLVISLILSVLSFKLNSIISISFLLICGLILSSLFKNKYEYAFENSKFNSFNFHIFLMFSLWFLMYFSFFTFIGIKVNRYIITALPAFVYFVILSLEYVSLFLNNFISYGDVKSIKKEVNGSISDDNIVFDNGSSDKTKTIKNRFSSLNIISVISIFLIILCIISAFSFTSMVDDNISIKSPQLIADYLINYDSNYSSKQVAVYNSRFYDWLLKMNTIPLIDEKIDYLESSNITYFISNNPFDLKNYTQIHRENDLYLYKHI